MSDINPLDHQQKDNGQDVAPRRSADENRYMDLIKEQAQRGKTHIENAQAYMMATFESDEELPMSQHYLLIAITGFFFFFIVWANFASLDEVTRGEGKVIPSSDVQAMQAQDSSVIEEILVREGEEVGVGAPLIRFSDIEAGAELSANRARFLGLQASIIRLQAEAEGRDELTFPPEVKEGVPSGVAEELNAFNANRQKLQNQISVIEEQVKQRQQEVQELETRINDIQQVLQLQKEERDVIAPLVERGSAPRLELLQLERGIQEKATELNSAMSNLPRAKAAVEEARARIQEAISSAQSEAQRELSTKQIELNEIRERLTAFENRKTRTLLTSRVNGVVQELVVNTIGAVVRPGEDVIKILPNDDQLIIEAKIRPADRAFIYPGQKAVVKLTAYDFSIYGGLDAKVVGISPSTTEDEKGNSFYIVNLQTNDTELKRGGQTYDIIPGMIASVDILTGEKTVMQYLLKPFVKTLDVAMTER